MTENKELTQGAGEATAESGTQQKRFCFSLVLPVHNAEDLLCNMINHLLDQTLSADKFQIIIVDAASTDKTGLLAGELAEKHPRNIRVVHCKEACLNNARNEGLALAEGEYTCFWDTAFTPGRNLLADVSNFLQDNAGLDVVCVPHSNDPEKFPGHWIFQKGSRVVNLFTENRLPLEHIQLAFFKTETARKTRFDIRLTRSSFTKFLYETLSYGMETGLCCTDAIACSSDFPAAQQQENDPEYYLPRVEFLLLELLVKVTGQKGYTPDFLSNFVLRNLIFYVKLARRPLFLSEEDCQRFWDIAAEVLQLINVRDIVAEKSISFSQKLWLLKQKYDSLETVNLCQNVGFAPRRQPSYYFCTDMVVGLDLFEIKDNKAIIECSLPAIDGVDEEFSLALCAGGTFYRGEYVGRRKYYVGMKAIRCDRIDYKIELPLSGASVDAEFYLLHGNRKIKAQHLATTRFFPIQQRYSKSYFVDNNWRMMLNELTLNFTRIGKLEQIKSELRFLKELWQKNLLGGRKAVLVRLAYRFLKWFKRKPIWLCSDRPEKADDNGEVFFEFLRKEHPEINSYFELREDSPDYARLKKIGPVLEPCSMKHKLKLLLADWQISSHADSAAMNELCNTSAYHDILHHINTIFLQHGIIKDDLSDWLQRKHHNFRGFVTSVTGEHDSIIHGDYHYSEREIWLTGLPRYDKLSDQAQRLITFMPTWRFYLREKVDSRCDLQNLSSLFYSSRYYEFYHALFTDKRLIDAAGEYQYQLVLLPHPQMQKWIKEFSPAPEFTLYGFDRTKSYREIYAESSLVVTDYSSAVFDFAYLHKPVVYAHFDHKEFFGNHLYQQGYFDYERDGFGEVEYDFDSTVNRIIDYMKNGCKLKEQYRNRIDQFFTFRDNNNCRRIFEKVIAAQKAEGEGK